MFRPKIIAVFIAIYAVGAFFLGANFDEIIKKQTHHNQLTSTNQLPLAQALSSLLIGFLGLGIVPLFENWLADESKNKAEDEAEKKMEAKYTRIFKTEYSQKIEQAINKFKKSNFYVEQPEIAESVCKIFTEIGQDKIQILRYEYDVAQNIAKILRNKNKRLQLTKKAVNYAIENNPSLDNKYHKSFRQDIFYSLGWLCFNLEQFTINEWTVKDENKLTSAIKDGVTSIKPYKDALDFIKDQHELKQVGNLNKKVLEYYANKLIEFYSTKIK
ncbi:hypothetical protein [Nostoc sp.]|uniref:hypothetical protein n=1 Tax=Nostoc sp. TaxID=1180 RepID=UPI002FFBA53D